MHVTTARRGCSTTDPEAGAGYKCRSLCEDGRAPGPRLQARPSVGTGRPGRTGRPSRRARNGAEARTCHAMPPHSVVERSRTAFSMKIFLETPESRPQTLQAHGEMQTLGAPPGRTFHWIEGQSGTHPYLYGRTCPASTHLWLRRTPQSPRLRRQPQRTQAGE